MSSASKLDKSELDEHFLRRSFDVARRAITHGNHPFGAILVDANGNVRRRFVGARSLPVFESMIAEASHPASQSSYQFSSYVTNSGLAEVIK